MNKQTKTLKVLISLRVELSFCILNIKLKLFQTNVFIPIVIDKITIFGFPVRIRFSVSSLMLLSPWRNKFNNIIGCKAFWEILFLRCSQRSKEGSCQATTLKNTSFRAGNCWGSVLLIDDLNVRMVTPLLRRWLQTVIFKLHIAWRVSKYGVFSGQYFPVFSPNTGKYGPEKTPYLDTFHEVSSFPVSTTATF